MRKGVQERTRPVSTKRRKAIALHVICAAIGAVLIGALLPPAAYAATATPQNSLTPGTPLTTGQALHSNNTLYTLVLQKDGNLVIYKGHTPTWASQTTNATALTIQTGGNVVLTASTGKVVWSTKTQKTNVNTLTLTNAGNAIAVYKAGPTATTYWNSANLFGTGLRVYPPGPIPVSGATNLHPGQNVPAGMYLSSANGADTLAVQADGNVVLYGAKTVLWATNTTNVRSLALTTDGQIEAVTATGRVVWSEGVAGDPVAQFVVQNDNNLVLYASWGPMWSLKGGPGTPPRPTPAWNGSVAVNLGAPTSVDQAYLVNYINKGRAAEGVPPLVLPSNYTTLTPQQQILDIINQEREDRGLPTFVGLDAYLTSLAQPAAVTSTDPINSFSIWAGGSQATVLFADALWMYDDGPGGDNLDCTAPGQPGCFGHALNIVRTNWNGFTGTLALGAGYATNTAWGISYTAAELPLTSPNITYWWAQELPYV